MPMIGAAYLRCSDPRQDKSIDQQRDEITRRAQADGVIIPPENWFIDEGLSGRSAKKRKSYQDLLRTAELQRDMLQGRSKHKTQRIDRLYVWAFSRIARNMFDCLRALATLDEADIDILSLTEPDAGDKSFRKLIRPILAWLAERYSEELSRNVQRGMRSQAERGFWVYGHAPYGYEAVPGDGGSRLQVTDATRAAFETVQRIFAEYLEGRDGFKRLAERLTLEAVPPPSRDDNPRERLGHTWRSKHISQILSSPTYAGHIVYDGEIVGRDAHTPAVSNEDFARAAAIRALKERKRQEGECAHNPIRLGERGLLTPWLRCGSCGGRMNVTVGGKSGGEDYYYYVCGTRTQNKVACTGLSIRVDRLDPAVLNFIETQLLTPENVQTLIAQALQDLTAAPDDRAAERTAIEAQITDLDRKIRLVGAQVLDGILAPEDARALNTPLIAQREHAKLRLATIPSSTALPAPDTIDADTFRAAIREAWSARPIEARREALDRMIDQITLSEGGAHIDYRCKDADPRFRHQPPDGPPEGSGPIRRGWAACPEVSPPVQYATGRAAVA